jgi:hypothetical protein
MVAHLTHSGAMEANPGGMVAYLTHSGAMEANPGGMVTHLTHSGTMEANPGGMVAHHIATVSCCCLHSPIFDPHCHQGVIHKY